MLNVLFKQTNKQTKNQTNKKKKQKQKERKKERKEKKRTRFKCTMPPGFVIPRGFSTLYRCSLITVAQDKPYHEKPLNGDCCNHKGSCTPIKPYLNIAAEISSSSFVRVSERQLAVSSLSKGISSTLNFMRALVLTGLELATSRTQNERRIDGANLTDYGNHVMPYDIVDMLSASVVTVRWMIFTVVKYRS